MSAFANCVNRADYFTSSGAPVKATLLEATGLEDPFTGGGIEVARAIVIPARTVLLRCYENPGRRFGSWWNTPREIGLLMEYAGRAGAGFDEGRDEGKGYLHAMNAVLHEWSGFSPDHLGYVVAIRTKKPFVAYYGEGRSVYGKNHRIKPGMIWDKQANRQRRIRQVFMKNVYKYVPDYVEEISPPGASVAGCLDTMVRMNKTQKLVHE